MATPLSQVIIQHAHCPLCESEDNVKGFKVQDEHGWWSYCFADHRPLQAEFPDFPERMTSGQTKDDCLWFVWTDSMTCLVEGPETHRLIQLQFQAEGSS